MIRSILQNTFVGFACALTMTLPMAACGSNHDDPVPTCDDLQKEVVSCDWKLQTEKDQAAQFGAVCQSTPFTDDCRKCLSGHLCGTTEQCDSLCGK